MNRSADLYNMTNCFWIKLFGLVIFIFSLFSSLLFVSGINKYLKYTSQEGSGKYVGIQHHLNSYNVCSKGEPGFSNDWLRQEFVHFMKVYDTRPRNPNTYGTKLPHQFAMWATIRHIEPAHIIESGINIGLGTWMLRQAAPQAQLILLDPLWPRGNQLVYKDKKKDTIYLTGNKFQDFSHINWQILGVDTKRALVYFDDHQAGIRRTMEAWTAGFTHIMFDDNFAGPIADNLSLKIACDLEKGKILPAQSKYTDNFSRISRPIVDEDLRFINRVFTNHIDIYFEFPFPWRVEGYNGEVLFPEYDCDDIKAVHNLQNPIDDKLDPHRKRGGYQNVCYVSLSMDMAR